MVSFMVSYDIVLYRILSYPIVSYRIVSYRIVSYPIVWYRIVSYRIVSYRCQLTYCRYCTFVHVSQWRKKTIETILPYNFEPVRNAGDVKSVSSTSTSLVPNMHTEQIKKFWSFGHQEE